MSLFGHLFYLLEDSLSYHGKKLKGSFSEHTRQEAQKATAVRIELQRLPLAFKEEDMPSTFDCKKHYKAGRQAK